MPLFKYHSDQTTVSSWPPWLFHQRLDSGLTLPFMDLHLMNNATCWWSHVANVIHFQSLSPYWSNFLGKAITVKGTAAPRTCCTADHQLLSQRADQRGKTFLALSCFLGSHFQLTKLVIIKMSARGKRTERELDGKKKKKKNLILAGAQFACDRTHI